MGFAHLKCLEPKVFHFGKVAYNILILPFSTYSLSYGVKYRSLHLHLEKFYILELLNFGLEIFQPVQHFLFVLKGETKADDSSNKETAEEKQEEDNDYHRSDEQVTMPPLETWHQFIPLCAYHKVFLLLIP